MAQACDAGQAQKSVQGWLIRLLLPWKLAGFANNSINYITLPCHGYPNNVLCSSAHMFSLPFLIKPLDRQLVLHVFQRSPLTKYWQKTWQKLLSKQLSKSQKTTSSKYVHEKLGPFLGHPSPIWMSIFKHSMLFHGVSIEVISGLPANSSRVLVIPLALLQRSVFDMHYKGHSEATMKKGIGGSWGSRPVESLGCKQSLRYSLSECPVQHWSRLEPLQLWFLPWAPTWIRHHSMLHLQHN